MKSIKIPKIPKLPKFNISCPKNINMYLIIFVFLLGVIFIIRTTSLQSVRPFEYQNEFGVVEGLENLNKLDKMDGETKHKSLTKEKKATKKALSKCPNMLIKDEGKILLYNNTKAKVPGVNPIVFNNLSEYAEFVEYLRAQNIKCPILYYEKMIDAQGDETYAIKSSPFTSDAGPQLDYVSKVGYEKSLVDASRDDPPYNKNSYPGFDASNQRVGKLTPLNNIPSK